MKLTKRGFLQSIGSMLADGAVADQTQAQSAKLAMLEQGVPVGLNAPIRWPDDGLYAQSAPTVPTQWQLPSWKAKQRAEERKRFLKDADPCRWRSAQFTSHEQKKARWVMKREYRRFMAGPWRRPEDYMGTIQQWKASQTIGKTLEELKGQIVGLQANPTGRYFNT